MNTTLRLWVVLDIGCLECGEETFIVSIYTDEEEAKKSAERYAEKMPEGYFDSRQHSLEIHPFTGAGE